MHYLKVRQIRLHCCLKHVWQSNQFIFSLWQVGYCNKQRWMCTYRSGYQPLPIDVRQQRLSKKRFYFPAHWRFAGNHWTSTAVGAATIPQDWKWNCKLINSISEYLGKCAPLTTCTAEMGAELDLGCCESVKELIIELINFYALKLKI